MRRAAAALLAIAAAACSDQVPPAADGDVGAALHEGPKQLPADEAARTANLAHVDPAALDRAEVAQVLPPGPGCAFAYTEAGAPVLVARTTQGQPLAAVIKLNGNLVELRSAEAGVEASLVAGPIVFGAGEVRATIVPLPTEGVEEKGELRQWQADMVFRIGDALEAGYRGFWSCGPEAAARS